MMYAHAVLVILALILAPLGAKAADLVVWWEQGFYAQEDEAVKEIIAAFEQETSKQVELVFYEQAELPGKIATALQAGQPPDFAFGIRLTDFTSEWALDDRLVDLTDTVGFFSKLFDPDALSWYVVRNERTGQKALYALPIGRTTNHVHAWKSLLDEAGFTLEDIPGEWEPFWSFWCDQVQPAVRKAKGRKDIWGAGLPMSVEASDTTVQFQQFVQAHEANWVDRNGLLTIDRPEVRRNLVSAMDSYTAIYRKGCTPPDSVSWSSTDNNRQFLTQSVVMTTNESLSIPNALKLERPQDYYENTATIAWPLGPSGKVFPIKGSFSAALVFKNGRHTAVAKQFVSFLIGEGWLAHYLDFAGERMLPSMPKLLDAPFWLDSSDPHRIAAVMQVTERSMQYDYETVSGDWRYSRVWQENVWGKAIHRVAADGISPEQAVDEAIARIKQILSE
jgi:multiple sugar transport system substrate-binding protein